MPLEGWSCLGSRTVGRHTWLAPTGTHMSVGHKCLSELAMGENPGWVSPGGGKATEPRPGNASMLKSGLWSSSDWGTVRAELSSFPTCFWWQGG